MTRAPTRFNASSPLYRGIGCDLSAGAQPSAPIPTEVSLKCKAHPDTMLCRVHFWDCKWRVFISAMQLNEATVNVVMKAAFDLHNYVWDHDSSNMEAEIQVAFSELQVNGDYV